MMRLWLLGTMAAALLLAGCGGRLDPLTLDVQEIMTVQGVNVALNCQHIARTRDGFCTGTLNPTEVGQVVSGLNLQPISSSELYTPQSGGCLAQPSMSGAASLQIYHVARRPLQLNLSSGANFAYLVLFHRTGTNAVCVQMSYAYG